MEAEYSTAPQSDGARHKAKKRPGNFPSRFFEGFCWQRLLIHIGEPLNCLCKISDGFIRIAMLDSIADAVLNVPLQYDLAAAVKR